MNAAHLLVVDGDEHVAALLCRQLDRAGFVTHRAHDAASMQRHLDTRSFALVVLDLALPGADVSALARRMRSRCSAALIALSSQAGALDRVLALEMGADDCMSKPLEPRELAARVRAVLRRTVGPTSEGTSPAAEHTTRFDGWELQRLQRRLTSPNGEPVALSDAEYALLSAFLQAPRRVVSREQLMTRTRGRDRIESGRSIDLLVSRLRQKLDAPPGTAGLIKTVRGAGYLLDVRSMNG